MSGVLIQVATAVGVVVMAAVALCCVALASLLLWHVWPIRVTHITHDGRTKRGLETPARIDWRSNAGAFNEITALSGISSRGKTRWFFGLMLLRGNQYDEALRHPKIIRPEQPQ